MDALLSFTPDVPRLSFWFHSTESLPDLSLLTTSTEYVQPTTAQRLSSLTILVMDRK